MSFHVVGPRDRLCVEVSFTLVIFQLPQQKLVIRTFFGSRQKYFRSVCIHVECIPKFSWSREDVGSPRSTSFINFFHMGSIFCFLPAILMSFTYTDKNKPCLRWTNKHSQFGTLSHPSSNRPSSNCLSHKMPASGRPYKFRSWRTTKSSMFDHDFDHQCRGRRI